MRFYFLAILFFLSSPFLSAQEKYIAIPVTASSFDSARVMQETKMKINCPFLSPTEKKIIQWINIARMYPRWYLHFRKIKNIDPVYTKTLLQTLQNMKPIKQPLIPSKSLWKIAYCHASTSGPIGYMGHERQSTQCDRKINAECLHYGGGTPATKVERLLIDKGVPTLGHREVMLDPKLKYVAVSILPFKKSKESKITVIDFSFRRPKADEIK
jgi:hypothetical protein